MTYQIAENIAECKITRWLTELQMPYIYSKNRSEVIIFFCVPAQPDSLILFYFKVPESIHHIIENIIDVSVSK